MELRRDDLPLLAHIELGNNSPLPYMRLRAMFVRETAALVQTGDQLRLVCRKGLLAPTLHA